MIIISFSYLEATILPCCTSHEQKLKTQRKGRKRKKERKKEKEMTLQRWTGSAAGPGASRMI